MKRSREKELVAGDSRFGVLTTLNDWAITEKKAKTKENVTKRNNTTSSWKLTSATVALIAIRLMFSASPFFVLFSLVARHNRMKW